MQERSLHCTPAAPCRVKRPRGRRQALRQGRPRMQWPERGWHGRNAASAGSAPPIPARVEKGCRQVPAEPDARNGRRGRLRPPASGARAARGAQFALQTGPAACRMRHAAAPVLPASLRQGLPDPCRASSPPWRGQAVRCGCAIPPRPFGALAIPSSPPPAFPGRGGAAASASRHGGRPCPSLPKAWRPGRACDPQHGVPKAPRCAIGPRRCGARGGRRPCAMLPSAPAASRTAAGQYDGCEGAVICRRF